MALYNQIDTSKTFEATDHVITVYNTMPFPRKEVVQLVIDTPKGTPKGKAFAGIAGQSMADEFYDIFDKDGNKLEYTELSCDEITKGVEREMDTKANRFRIKRRRILLAVDVPASSVMPPMPCVSAAPSLFTSPKSATTESLSPETAECLKPKISRLLFIPTAPLPLPTKRPVRSWIISITSPIRAKPARLM